MGIDITIVIMTLIKLCVFAISLFGMITFCFMIINTKYSNTQKLAITLAVILLDVIFKGLIFVLLGIFGISSYHTRIQNRRKG